MLRVALIHWKAREAEERAATLRSAGFECEALAPSSGAALRELRERPPDAFAIDLTRLPSHGRAVALELRRSKSTRAVPIVLAGGAPEKVDAIRALLPDAVFAEWDAMPEALARAVANPPAAPTAVPAGAMAGYSGTPLAKKLRIHAGAAVALLGAPEGFESALAGLPEGVRLSRHARGGADLVLLFARSRADLARRFPAAARAVNGGGGLWLVWPKKTSGMAADLTQAAVRALGLEAGWVDYKICALDETWSGLLFARRRS
jgi:hypothetical protein